MHHFPKWCIIAPSFRGGSHAYRSGSYYDRSRSGSFLLEWGVFSLVCAFASASLRRIELSRFWINRCLVSAIKRRHSGSGIASSFRIVLSTISLACLSRMTGTISQRQIVKDFFIIFQKTALQQNVTGLFFLRLTYHYLCICE